MTLPLYLVCLILKSSRIIPQIGPQLTRLHYHLTILSTLNHQVAKTVDLATLNQYILALITRIFYQYKVFPRPYQLPNYLNIYLKIDLILISCLRPLQRNSFFPPNVMHFLSIICSPSQDVTFRIQANPKIDHPQGSCLRSHKSCHSKNFPYLLQVYVAYYIIRI